MTPMDTHRCLEWPRASARLRQAARRSVKLRDPSLRVCSGQASKTAAKTRRTVGLPHCGGDGMPKPSMPAPAPAPGNISVIFVSTCGHDRARLRSVAGDRTKHANARWVHLMACLFAGTQASNASHYARRVGCEQKKNTLVIFGFGSNSKIILISNVLIEIVL